MIPIAAPEIGEEEIKAVNAVLESGMLAQGPRVAELEKNFAKFCGTKYAVAANNGTAAIHMALMVAGVGLGDEVITVPYSFIGTINPILMQQARPVLVDIKLDSFNLDVSKVEAAITPKTKAILPVDLYGQPYDYDELKAIADKHKLVIIEDACQAIGADYKNKKTGSLGDLGCFSLYATKNITCGEGGVITTDNKEYADRMKRLRQNGMTAMNGTYEYTELGYNYRMSDLHASIAVEQLKKVNKFNAARQKNANLLRKGLGSVPGIVLPITAPNRSHVFHQFTIRITDKFPIGRDKLVNVLRAEGITAGVYYPKPLHSYKHIAVLGYKNGDFPEAERAAREVISLPVHPALSQSDINKIVKVIASV